jgi:hypothetical protein
MDSACYKAVCCTEAASYVLICSFAADFIVIAPGFRAPLGLLIKAPGLNLAMQLSKTP